MKSGKSHLGEFSVFSPFVFSFFFFSLPPPPFHGMLFDQLPDSQGLNRHAPGVDDVQVLIVSF
jgi:hypothetical protein